MFIVILSMTPQECLTWQWVGETIRVMGIGGIRKKDSLILYDAGFLSMDHLHDCLLELIEFQLVQLLRQHQAG
jgi:hypothetical protein